MINLKIFNNALNINHYNNFFLINVLCHSLIKSFDLYLIWINEWLSLENFVKLLKNLYDNDQIIFRAK